MKKKLTVSVLFVISLVPMLFPQFGGRRGVQEISGLIQLFHPFGVLSVLLFVLGVWVPFQRRFLNRVLATCGMAGIVFSELYQFFTWHILTITGKFSLQSSVSLAFPAFYLGLCVSLLMIAVYWFLERRMRE